MYNIFVGQRQKGKVENETEECRKTYFSGLYGKDSNVW